jgi:short-subunit dehydrogenase
MGFTKNLRKELAPQNIKVTTLLPGATYTDSWASANLPASQFIQPKDVALLISTCMQLSPAAVVEEILLQPMTGPF